MPMTKYVVDWFHRADEDLQMVDLALKEDGPVNPVCFHAQQAAEKYLKGFLAFHAQNVRKIHDLKALLQECQNVDPSFRELDEDTAVLNRFYMTSRYPDDTPEFSSAECREASEAAVRIKEFVLKKMDDK
ncbi:MAG: HEPN domain-containing protein [bacterium]|nr:HEPN domain-containing protein [bacterium]MDZ4285058.1 HEPN domain-containing protein [Patescibacteria group bacterium]